MGKISQRNCLYNYSVEPRFDAPILEWPDPHFFDQDPTNNEMSEEDEQEILSE